MGSLSPVHWLIVITVVLLVFNQASGGGFGGGNGLLARFRWRGSRRDQRE